jgi:hypothetical protein
MEDLGFEFKALSLKAPSLEPHYLLVPKLKGENMNKTNIKACKTKK